MVRAHIGRGCLLSVAFLQRHVYARACPASGLCSREHSASTSLNSLGLGVFPLFAALHEFTIQGAQIFLCSGYPSCGRCQVYSALRNTSAAQTHLRSAMCGSIHHVPSLGIQDRGTPCMACCRACGYLHCLWLCTVVLRCPATC